MRAQTLRTLAVLAATILVISAMVPAPMARLFGAGVSALLALLPLGWGSRGQRWAGVVILVAAMGLAAEAYPEATVEHRQYVQQR